MLNFERKISLGKVAVASAVLGAFLAGPLAPSLLADDCQRETAKYDHNLHDAIAKHGVNSKQADHWRHELNEEREKCWNANHKWWDEDGHRWHTDRDWDEHDHDH